MAFILIFVPAYTRVSPPRWLITTYGVGLTILFITNIVTPYGVWLSGEPTLLPSTFHGEPYTALIVPPLSVVQYVHLVFVLSVFGLSFACAFKLMRQGERQRGWMLAIALVVAVMQHVIDVVRDAIGGSWPYVAEFGLVTWGLIMSVQLAIDFRVSGQRLHATLKTAEQRAYELARMVEATLHVRDKLNTPLQTLELSLATRTAGKPDDEQTLAELRRAVTQLAQLGRAVKSTTDEGPAALPELERAA